MKEIDFCNNPLFQKAILNSTGLLIVSLDREGNVVFINDSGAELLGYKPERVIGKNWFEQFLPDDIKDEVFNIFRNIIRGKVRKFKVYQNAVQTKDKNVKYIQFTNSIVKERGKIVGTISVGIDVTQNKIASDKLSRLLMISQILIKTSYRLSGVYDINRIASVIVNAAKKLTNSKYGYLGYIDEESGYFYIPKFSREIMDECRLRDKQVVFKEFKGLWGWSLKNKKPILVNDITRDKRSTGVPEGHIKIKRFLALPVIMDKELIGQLAVANSNRDYTDEDIEILQRVVNLYIPSYQAAKYYEMEREILKRYTISLGASNQIVNMFNLDTKKVIFEGSLERIFGFTKEELPDTFEKFLEFIHPDDREIFIKRLAESKEFIDMQLRFRKKDGDFIYIQLRGYTSIERKTGERLIYGIISDISDRIRFEDEIIRREREIREIFENMPVPVVVMDKFRNIIFVNREFTRNYGYKKEDIQDFSKWVRDAFTFASKEEIDRYINFVFESKEDLGEEQNIIIKMIGKDGNWFYIKILKRIIGSNVVLILEDITEQKFREKKISLINTLLQINTEVNREISKIDSTVEVMKRVVKIFSNLEIFKEVHSFCFTDEQPRKLLDVTVDNVSLVKGELPDCIKNASGGDNSIVVKMEDEICSGCQFHKNNEGISTIVLSIKDENLPYGTLNLSLNKSIQIEGEAENILKGIARDIAFRITNIHLQYKNKEYIERIRNLARIPFENPNPLIRISDNGVLIYANPASQSLIKCWGTAVGEPVPDFVKSDIEYAFSINKVYEKEYQVEDKIFNAYIVPFKDTKYVNIYFNDITEKKKKEIELLESEERFRKLFYEAPDGFYLMDEEGKFLDGNAAAEEITGYKREELIGKNFIESGLIPEDKLADALDFFKRSILNGESGPFEQEIIKKDGSRAVLELFVRYIELQGKRVILGMARDVTDRIRMQNEILRTKRELERLNENLELEVEKKTYQIKKSEKMALIIKNIIITASNLADVDEIMKESGYYLAQSFDFKAYGYYLSERKDYSPNLFLNGSLCKMEIDRDIFNENVLKNIARHFCNVKKVERLFPQDMDFLPEFIEQLQKNCLEILIVPVHYKEICYGFLFFFVAKGTDIDEILIEGFEQIGLQIGAVIRQKKTEEERERISRLHESILRSAGDGIIGTDAELNITFMNESALKVLGYNSNDVVGVDICKLLHTGKDGLIHKENECAFAYVCDLKKDIEEEGVKFVRAGGEIIYVDKRIAPIIENGNFTGLVVVFRDITEEKRRREEINRFAVALNQYPIAIAFIDRDGYIKYVNKAFVKHTGISERELMTLNLEDINKGIMKILNSSGKDHVITRQHNFIRGEGERVYENITIAPIKNSDGDVNNYAVIKEDITPHIELQESHRKAREAAEQANRAKSAFLATISHELRTPLTGLSGFIDELLETKLDQHQLDILSKARDISGHMNTIINDVLDYSTIESGKMKLELKGFAFLSTIEEVKSITTILASQKRLELRFEIADDVPRFLRGDSKRLKQVLINLISNATKFTHNGGVYVTISKKAEYNGKVVLLFSVRDTGIGIKDEDKMRIFSPFEQADSSISRRFGGTGLGLAISKWIVEKMNGEIWVESEFGKGSDFRFTAEFDIITENEVEEEEKFVPLKGMLKGGRVLLVEDNKYNQEVIVNFLKKYGAEVEIAIDGQDAIDTIFSHPPDYYNFVLMDIQMPVMDGKTATRIIRQNENYKNLPIIAMTAHAFKDDVEDALRSGMNAHISKPFDTSRALMIMSKYYFNKDAKEVEGSKSDIEIPEDLKNLSIIDITDGLARFSYDVKNYRRMLKSFGEKYKYIDNDIEKLLEENKIEEAEAIVHTIKGVSGNLSIKRLYDRSVYLDILLKRRAEIRLINEAFSSFAHELRLTVEELQRLPSDETHKFDIIDDNQYKELLERLYRALEGGDAESINIFVEIEGNLRKDYGAEIVDRIKVLIESFDHTEALKLLREISNKN